MGVQLVLPVSRPHVLSFLWLPYFTYPAHDLAIAMQSVLPSIYLKSTLRFPAWPWFQSFLSSHMAMQKWCLVSYTSSLLYCLLYDIFPSNPPHCKPDELLKNPNFVVLYSVSSWAESPSPRKAFTMSGKSCFWDPLYSSRKRHILPSALCFGQTERVCFLQSFHIPFPNPLFYEVLYATLSQVSSFLSLLWP